MCLLLMHVGALDLEGADSLFDPSPAPSPVLSSSNDDHSVISSSDASASGSTTASVQSTQAVEQSPGTSPVSPGNWSDLFKSGDVPSSALDSATNVTSAATSLLGSPDPDSNTNSNLAASNPATPPVEIAGISTNQASASASPSVAVASKDSPPDSIESNPPDTSPVDVKKDDLTSIAAEMQPAKKLPSLPVDSPPNLEQTPDVMAASAPPPVTPTENVTLNLINRLVQRGILTKEDAADLIRQAKEDAQRVSQQAQFAQQAATQAATAQQMAMEAAAPPSSDDAVSVSYVPEIVKSEMRDEIKRDVMAAAQSEGWAQPNVPEWVRKFRPFMDFRFRYQGIYFPDGNSDNPLDTLNFNWINTGQPFNISQANGNQSPPIGYPTYDTTQNRQQMRIRFRFGADMNLGDNFTGGFRIGTGQNGSPVSENQTLGAANNGQFGGAGGNFSNYAIWLDRAFLKYELGEDPDRMAAISFGRFDNPFYTPTTIMWANDIAFDGIAAQARYKIFKGITPFATAGIFPIFNTDLNFPAQQQPKISSYDKYLYAAQAGIDWKITKDLHYKGAVGYYNFQNVQGQVSAPQVAYDQNTPFSTDDSRPTFAQKGNTYMALREIPAVPENNYGTINQFQYFGLSTPFQVLSANGRLEYRHWEPFVVSLSGEWDQNLAWNAQNIMNNGPSQLRGNINNPGSNGTGYGGGNNAWIIQTKIGSGALQKRWDWDFGVAYRYVESDAVIDGFCDSDFGGGGTNLKGFSVGGNLALSRSVFIGARWLSATGIAGPQYKADIIQLDINSRF